MRAEAFQAFGTAFRPERTQSALMDPEQTWLVPKVWHHGRGVPPPLTGAWLEAASNYRAPI